MRFTGLSLGCGNFGGIGSAPEFFGRGTDDETAYAIMDRAWASGVRWFDTADAYGGGHSEELIGRWRAERGADALVVTTKTFNPMHAEADHGLAPDRIRRQLAGSLERLGLERVDLYLAHEPDRATPLAATIECFEELQADGLIGAWGLSNYGADGILEALAVGTPSLVQNSFSLLERGDQRDVLPLCAEHDIAYVPFGPLAGGWLTGKYRRGEPFPAGSRMTLRPGPYEKLVADEVFDGLEQLEQLAAVRGVQTATLAFAWVLAQPGVTGAVCGPNRPDQLDPVLAARDLDLSHDELVTIGALFP